MSKPEGRSMGRNKRIHRAIANVLFILAAFAGLWSCDLETRAQVVSGDVVDLLSGSIDEALMNAVILFPRPSDDLKDEIISFLSLHFRRFGNLRQVEIGMNSFLSADVAFPMRRSGERSSLAGKDLLSFYVSQKENRYAVSLTINEARFDEISKFVRDKTMQEISLEDLEVSFSFSNNSSAKLNFATEHCYVDGMPILNPSTFPLGSDRSADIRLSDVLRDSITMTESGTILEFWW
jgi:hypothetical protein